jgi:hypothetical protein
VGLRELDERVLPQLAERAHAVRDAVALPDDPAAALRALDDRWASTGALRVVRDAPALLALLAATVLVAGAGVGAALALGGELDPLGTSAAPPVRLGPPVGADAEQHLATARERTVELLRTSPGTRSLALVSVRDELTVEGTERLVAGSQLVVRRVYVRAPVPGLPELLQVEPGADATRTLTALFEATAVRKAAEQRELQDLARSVASAPGQSEEGRSEEGQSEEGRSEEGRSGQGEPAEGPAAGAQASYEAAAATAGREAAAYRGECPCVLAVVVEGTAEQLAELLALPSVRGVEVAPRGADLPEVEVAPLSPDTTGTVPPAPVPGG